MFKKIENKIKEIALQIHNSSDNENIYEDSKYIYELAVIYRFLSKKRFSMGITFRKTKRNS